MKKMEIPILSFDQEYITVKEIHEMFINDTIDVDKTFKVLGTIDSVRWSKNGIMFATMRSKDSIRTIQCTYLKKEEKDELWDELEHTCSLGACFVMCGKIVKLDTKQLYEFVIDLYTCFGKIKSKEEYPLAGKTHLKIETLRTIPHLKCQTKIMNAVDLITSTAYQYFHKSMKRLKIREIQPVLLTSNECESGSHPFVVTTLFSDPETGDFSDKLSTIPKVGDKICTQKDFFKKPVFLTVSGQLHGEAIAVVTKSSKYWMTKAFRAEPSSGNFHAAEFLMPEWEIISDKLEDNMKVAEYTIKLICQAVLKDHLYELEFLEQYRQKIMIKEYVESMKKVKDDWEKEKIEQAHQKKLSQLSLMDRLKLYVSEPFIISTHAECIKRMLEDEQKGLVKFEKSPVLDDDISREHEHYITDVIYKGRPVFLRFFPKKVKAFYMPLIQTDKGDVERVNGYDLLLPYIGEVVGGSQRIESEKELCQRMDELKMKTEPLQWYIDLRKYGSVPHGGAGLGFGRLIMALTGLSSIRDTDQFPRAYGLEMRC